MTTFKTSAKRVAVRCLHHLGAPALMRRRSNPPDSAVVLAYHSVTDDAGYALPGIRITPELFARQIKHLAQHYVVLDLHQIVEIRGLREPLPTRCVAITFDDGYLDNYTNAFPVLSKYNMPATVFATVDPVLNSGRFWVSWLYEALQTPDSIPAASAVFGVACSGRDAEEAFNAISTRLNHCSGKERHQLVEEFARQIDGPPATGRMLNPTQMLEMQAGGVSFGSHTMTHPILANVDAKERAQELQTSRELLSRTLSRPVEIIAYPNGRSITHNYDDDVISATKDAGYVAAVTSKRGPVQAGSDNFALPRMGISQQGGMARFALNLERFRARASEGVT